MTTWQEEQKIAQLKSENETLIKLIQGQSEAMTKLYEVCETYRMLVRCLLEENDKP